jgi:4-hydroxy-3-methylbut-2-en-1-yl diphosphate synthase IspG/GcpE
MEPASEKVSVEVKAPRKLLQQQKLRKHKQTLFSDPNCGQANTPFEI